MTRIYYGSIKGKFWPGIQSSRDVEYLCNTTPILSYKYIGCNCDYVEGYSLDYCYNCYVTKKNHMKQINIFDKELIYQTKLIKYYIYKDPHKNQIIENLKFLELLIDIDSFDVYFENNDYVLVKKPNYINIDENNMLVARYCLGLQILEYFKQNEENEMYIFCEL